MFVDPDIGCKRYCISRLLIINRQLLKVSFSEKVNVGNVSGSKSFILTDECRSGTNLAWQLKELSASLT